MNNHELATAFVYGATEGKGSNMFIEGNAIFSYGYHFPIALRLKKAIGIRPDYSKAFLFNTDSYSSSTSRHQRYVREELDLNGDLELIECTTNEIKTAIDYPDEPIILHKYAEYETIEMCFERVKEILKEKGIRRAPVRKWQKQVEDYLLIKKL